MDSCLLYKYARAFDILDLVNLQQTAIPSEMALLVNFLTKQSDQATTASSTGNAPQIMPDEELTICHQIWL